MCRGYTLAMFPMHKVRPNHMAVAAEFINLYLFFTYLQDMFSTSKIYAYVPSVAICVEVIL